MIVVVDCGIGNLQSVVRALERVGGRVQVASNVDDVAAADKVVLPGVGALGRGMGNLERQHLADVLRRKVLHEGTPLLGICLGLQMLTRSSEEGDATGLGWIDGRTCRIRCEPTEPQVKIPHMGWNTLTVQRDCPLLRGVPADACFYFAHSFCVYCDDPSVVAATTRYGSDFVSVLQRDNVFGTQFHPEKSQANGLIVLRNFVEYAVA